MASSLSRNVNLGTTGTSALLRSAASAAMAESDYQDKIQALNWSTGPQDQGAYTDYSKYLQGRTDKLNATGSVANLSKALTLNKTLIDTTRQYNSSQILQANIGIQEGNYSDPEKAVLLRNLANQAYASGDYQNGLHLEEQYNSTIIKMQSAAASAVSKGQSSNNALYTNYKKQFTDLEGALKEQVASGTISGAMYYKSLATTLGAKASIFKQITDPSNPLGLDPEHQASASEDYNNLISSGDLGHAQDIAQQMAAGGHPLFEENSNGKVVARDLPRNGHWQNVNGIRVYDTSVQDSTNFGTQQAKNKEGQTIFTPAKGANTALTKFEMINGDQMAVRHSQGAGDFGIDPSTGQFRLIKDIPGEAGLGTEQQVTKSGTTYNSYVLGKDGKPVIGKDGQAIRNQNPDQSYQIGADGNPVLDSNGKPKLLPPGDKNTGAIPNVLQALAAGVEKDLPAVGNVVKGGLESFLKGSPLGGSFADTTNIQAIMHASGNLLEQMHNFVTAHHIANNLPTYVSPALSAIQTLLGLASTHANQLKQAQITAQQQASARAQTNAQLAAQAAARMQAAAAPGPTVAKVAAARPGLPFPNPVPAGTPNAPAVQEQHTVANINQATGFGKGLSLPGL